MSHSKVNQAEEIEPLEPTESGDKPEAEKLLQEGPCCRYRRIKRVKYLARLRGILAVLDPSPRMAHRAAEDLAYRVPSSILDFVMAEECPCHSHPEPELFRRFIGKLLEAKKHGTTPNSLDERLDLLERLAQEAIREEDK